MGRILNELKSYVNVKAWIGMSELKSSGNKIASQVKEIFAKPISHHDETFEEALKRLNLSEQDVVIRIEAFQKMVFVYLLMAGLLYLYLLYLIWERYFLGSLVTIAVIGVVCGYAFRFHFWLFQLKHRKLGCTFDEWMRSTFLGEKS